VRVHIRQRLVRQRHRLFALVSLLGVGIGVAALGSDLAAADSSFSCPAGTYQGLLYQFDPPVASFDVGNWPVVYVGVGLEGGGHVQYGDGSAPMGNTVLNVLVDQGVNATDAHLCKIDGNATTTTTTTVPVTTTTVPVTTTTVPVTTTTVPVTTTSVPVTTTTVPVTTTTVPVTTTTDVGSGGPTTTVGTTSTTAVDSFPAVPTTLPSPGSMTPVTQLPSTGARSSGITLAIATALLIGGALILRGVRRRVPTLD
jgi:LPXTG-motif cell wall-anchored protein